MTRFLSNKDSEGRHRLLFCKFPHGFLKKFRQINSLTKIYTAHRFDEKNSEMNFRHALPLKIGVLILTQEWQIFSKLPILVELSETYSSFLFKGDFKCLVCSQMFDTAGKLSNHSCTTKTEKCSKCDFEAKTVAILNHHVRKMHKEDLTCVQCDLKFNTQHKLRLHMLKEHKISKDQERCLCSLCGKTLVGRSNFKKHEREKHGIDNISRKRIVKPLKINCSKCSSNFNSVVELNIHATTCQEVSHNFQCPSCPLTWCSGPVLNLHLKADHKMGEIYTCNVCGKCFKRKISVDSHNKVEHEGIKDHVCHLCGTGFARAQGLKFHIQRVHEHSGRYACEYCDFKTVAQMKLDIHVNEVHTKAIKFHCQECNFFCYRKGGLLAHVKTVHLKLKPHECPTCPEAYGRRKELEKHRSLTGH